MTYTTYRKARDRMALKHFLRLLQAIDVEYIQMDSRTKTVLASNCPLPYFGNPLVSVPSFIEGTEYGILDDLFGCDRMDPLRRFLSDIQGPIMVSEALDHLSIR